MPLYGILTRRERLFDGRNQLCFVVIVTFYRPDFYRLLLRSGHFYAAELRLNTLGKIKGQRLRSGGYVCIGGGILMLQVSLSENGS